MQRAAPVYKSLRNAPAPHESRRRGRFATICTTRRRTTASCGGIVGRCSPSWRRRRRAGSKRGISCQSKGHVASRSRRRIAVAQAVVFKGRARSIWRACTGSASRTLWDNISGRAATSCRTVGRDQAVIREYIQKQERKVRAPGPIGALALTRPPRRWPRRVGATCAVAVQRQSPNWSRRASSRSCFWMYSRMTASSRPTVDTK